MKKKIWKRISEDFLTNQFFPYDLYDSALGRRIEKYITEWLSDPTQSGYDYTAESRDLDVIPDEYDRNATNVGVTPRDRSLRLMSRNPMIVEKITDQHNL